MKIRISDGTGSVSFVGSPGRARDMAALAEIGRLAVEEELAAWKYRAYRATGDWTVDHRDGETDRLLAVCQAATAARYAAVDKYLAEREGKE